MRLNMAVAGACLVVVLGWGGLVYGFQVPAEEPPTDQAQPKLELSTDHWNFGQVWQGEPLKCSVTVKNAGTAPLEIVKVQSSCGCTVPSKPKSPLAPGESVEMTISYDSLRKVGAAHQKITVISNDPNNTNAVVRVTGEVKRAYAVKPRSGLVFGQLYQTSRDVRRCEIVNEYKEKLDLRLKEGQDFGPYDIKLREIEPGMRYELSATTRPPLDVGTLRLDIELETGLELVPEAVVIAYGFVQPPVMVMPKRILFPTNSVMEMRKILRVTHAPDMPVEVTEAKSSHPAIGVELREAGHDLVHPDQRQWEVEVTLPPGDLLPKDEPQQIEITTSASDPEYRKLVVPVELVTPRRPSAQKP